MQDKLGVTPAALQAALDGDLANAFTAVTPGGIEAQEAAGQRDMAYSFRTLPKEMIVPRASPQEDDPGGCSVGWKVAETFGFRIDVMDHDDLFYGVVAPKGWSIRPTEHSMHSDIVDEKGRVRGSIFYKAAFYDRRAHGQWSTRYRAEGDHAPGHGIAAFKGVDTATGETLFTVPVPEDGGDRYAREAIAENEVRAKLAERVPDYQDVTAYWSKA